MVGEAEVRYNEQVKAGAKPPSTQPKFWASNLEDVEGKYHTVTCLDVMIHYPQDKAGACSSCSLLRLCVSHAARPSGKTRPPLVSGVELQPATEGGGMGYEAQDMTHAALAVVASQKSSCNARAGRLARAES